MELAKLPGVGEINVKDVERIVQQNKIIDRSDFKENHSIVFVNRYVSTMIAITNILKIIQNLTGIHKQDGIYP